MTVDSETINPEEILYDNKWFLRLIVMMLREIGEWNMIRTFCTNKILLLT